MRVPGPADIGGVTDVGDGGVPGAADRLARRRGQRTQPLLIRRGDGVEVAGAFQLSRIERKQWGFLDDDVDIGPGQTEGADAGTTRTSIPRPRPRITDQIEIDLAPVHVRGCGGDRWLPRNRLVAQREQHLGDAAQPGRRFGMTYIRLDGADRQLAATGAASFEHRSQGLEFDGIAERRAGAMRLDEVDVAGFERCLLERKPNDLLLRLSVRNGEAAAGAVMRHRRAAKQRCDRVPLTQRSGEAGQHEHRAALADAKAVRLGRERFRASVGRERTGAREIDRLLRRQCQVNAADDGEFAFRGAQRLAGLMQRQ